MMTERTGITPIAKERLKAGAYYIGEGRFLRGIAFWDGYAFHGWTLKFGQYVMTAAGYGEKGFDPIEELIGM